jgi:hypothetical protein
MGPPADLPHPPIPPPYRAFNLISFRSAAGVDGSAARLSAKARVQYDG